MKTPRRKLLNILVYLSGELERCADRDARFYGVREALWIVERSRNDSR